MKNMFTVVLLLSCLIPVTVFADSSDLEQRVKLLEKKVADLEQQVKNSNSSQLGMSEEAIKQKLSELQFENKDKMAAQLANVMEEMKKTIKKGAS